VHRCQDIRKPGWLQGAHSAAGRRDLPTLPALRPGRELAAGGTSVTAGGLASLMRPPAAPSLRFTTAAVLALSACAQPHEIDLAARPTLLPDAVVKVWTRDATVEITAVRMTDDSIFGRPITNTLHDPHTVGFALKQVSRLVVTQQPGAAGVATQSALLIGFGALVLAFFVAVATYRAD
jgi:hypothetical protein